MDKLAIQDCDRILQCLHATPMTVAAISKQMHLSTARVGGIIQILANSHQIHAPRCIKGPKGNPVNLWEMHPSLKSPE
ncbi:hypothetical protein HAQ01_11505 [Acidithiobacillus thiooxidans]|uniref:hypothetical protein n=1 Tax=Acidithiobacillus thiooxidans TaxID=930 RepID=UPI001C068251|nr:hypothetical protein [Acidithiobacillus thiooxidans]MBU2794001.1 hypothetical protein [Acidithiobacillus thiooxidans]